MKDYESKIHETSQPQVRVHQFGVDEVLAILERGRPLTGEEIAARVPAETYAPARRQAGDEAAFPVPESLGAKLLPAHYVLGKLFCFCFRRYWSIEYVNGQLVYVLRCEYLCLRQLQVAA